jgi:hypothetical protein
MHPVLNPVWHIGITVLSGCHPEHTFYIGLHQRCWSIPLPTTLSLSLSLFSPTDTIRDKLTIILLVKNLSYTIQRRSIQNVNANEYFNLVSSFVHPPLCDFSILKHME